MFMVKYYLLITILCFAAVVAIPNLLLKVVCGWVGISIFLVTIAYLYNIPSIFKKNEDGKIVWWIRWAFIPFLLGVKAYNAWSRSRDKIPAIHHVAPNLYVSRRLLSSEISELKKHNVNSIVDVTAEFAGLESAIIDKQFDYFTIPVLDHTVPTTEQLKHALNWIDTQIAQDKAVVVHCALGRGRSVFVVAAYLLSKDPHLTVEQALDRIHNVRSTARLNKRQLRALHKLRNEGELEQVSAVWLIANPVSGAGAWHRYGKRIIDRLTTEYPLKIKFTSKDISAEELTKEAMANNAGLVVAAGGDGTLSEVANMLVGSDVRFGAIPLGTANTLCHVLYGGEIKVFPVEKPCEAILSGQEKKIDIAYCNEKLMLLVLGIGFEQKMIEYAEREKKNQSGQLAYLNGFFNSLAQNTPIDLTYQQDDSAEQSLSVSSLVVANTAPFTTVLAQGGPMPEPSDGLLHITYLEGTQSVGERLLALSDITLSALDVREKAQRFTYNCAQRVVISAPQPFDYVVDGEPFTADRLVVTIKRNALTICTL
ncbi:hypothetical protein F9817_21065 [Vibrio sp. CAIM 722]|uniref:Methylglyoxal synthase n=1 Tax=Vibrio eleionomae TaxID=2653505 RepID=A0A7X4RW89_9VIBR|nr:diacylglycerol kinase family protein [Vibrio eleionomae]MZI95676.1 hypothetical protein [Vibrio eleionomae]